MVGQTEFSYADRYGIKPTSRWKLPATLIAILGISWVMWAGWHHAHPNIRTTLISFEVTGDKAVTIRYEILRADKDSQISCTLVARDFDKNIIGQIEDEIPVGTARITREVIIPTRTKPVNAAVLGCSAK